jgi:hypothetical protein
MNIVYELVPTVVVIPVSPANGSSAVAPDNTTNRGAVAS